MTTEEKLKNFYEYSMQSAKAEGDYVLQEYQANLDKVFADHQTLKCAQAEAALHDETEKLRRDSNRTLSDEQVRIRRTLSKKQNEIKTALFSEVAKKLEALKAGPEYAGYLVRKIKEAKEFAGSDPLKVYIDPSDASLSDRLKAETGVDVTLSTTVFHGGIRAVIESKHVLIDNSFDTLTEEAKAKFSIS